MSSIKQITLPDNSSYYLIDINGRHMIASEYAISTAYFDGDFVIYNDELYRITADITAETNTQWADLTKTNTTISTEIKNIKAQVSQVLHYRGVTTTVLTDGATTNPIIINGNSYTATDGDVVIYDSTEYLFNGTIWQAFGSPIPINNSTISFTQGGVSKGSFTLNQSSNETIALDGNINPNLLINGDFRINQRGEQMYTTAGEYTFDRWKLVSGNVTITAPSYTGIILTGTITQTLENPPTGDVTISLAGDPDRINQVEYSYNNGVLTLTTHIDVQITWVKLETGTVATPFVPKSYATELSDCQRYCLVIASSENNYAPFMIAQADGTTKLKCYIFNNKLRVKPTLTMKFITQQSVFTGKLTTSPTDIEPSDYTLSTWSNGVIKIEATVTGAINNRWYEMRANYGKLVRIILDSEIY